MALAYIGIGSNQGAPAANVETAIARLGELGTVTARSRRYRTKPWGMGDQPDFVNAVIALDTLLEPRPLLERLKAIESELGRTPTYRWGPRVIDLDILTYGDRTIEEPDLIVPHARLRERAFVLVPLAEVDPRFISARDALGTEELASVRLEG